MTAFTLSFSDLYDLANAPKPEGTPNVAEVEALVRREFAFVGRPLKIVLEGDFVTVSFEENPAAVMEAERLTERAAKKAREGQYEKAISLWERVLELQPSRHIARRDLAMAQFERGNMEAAKDHLIEILRFNPKDAWSWVVLGNIYAKGKDDLETAEKHLRRAIELTPNDPWALNSLAAVNLERGRTEEAIRLFRRAIASRPETANPYYGLAMTLHRLGRESEAVQTLRDMFANAEQQDARSRPVFQNAREIYVAMETVLAKRGHSENFKTVENFRAELEKRSGYPIRVVNADLPDKTGATIQVAWKHERDYHLIKCREGYPEHLLDHLKAHELKHLEMECAAREAGRNRFYTTTAQTRQTAILSIQNDIRRLQKQGYAEDSIERVVLTLVNGLNAFLFNCPLDMIIETNLRRDMPGMADAQYLSTGVLAREAVEVLKNPQILKLLPRNVARASNALNGAYALFLDDLFAGASDHAAAYRGLDSFRTSEKLFDLWRSRFPELKPGDEYDLVNEFAEIVGLRNWYEWKTDPGEHEASAEPLKEGTTNPELLRDKHPAAVFFFLDSLQRFERMAPEQVRAVAFEVAMLGREGLDYASPDKKYRLKEFPGEEFSGLQMMCFMYAGFKRVAPEHDLGMDLNDPFLTALSMHERQSEK